ncbi:MAG TPA: hypothetical protein VNA89_09930, partial [Gemmatimonadaceae bacterium]|nr:hypothetical protein [Gemmatimonadaceae bacterium]
QQREQSASGIPILKDLPLIGPLFRSTQQRRRGTTELFIFLTPHVLRTDQDVDDATRGASEATDNLRRELPDTLPAITMPPRSTPP